MKTTQCSHKCKVFSRQVNIGFDGRLWTSIGFDINCYNNLTTTTRVYIRLCDSVFAYFIEFSIVLLLLYPIYLVIDG